MARGGARPGAGRKPKAQQDGEPKPKRENGGEGTPCLAAKPKTKTEALNHKQARFVAEYLLDLNATQAAIRAGYSEKTAQVQGSRLLSHAIVAAEIAKGQAKHVERLTVTAERIVEELAFMALYDPGEIAKHPMSGPEDIPKLPASARRAIVGWGWDKAGNFTLKLSPKTASLHLLAQHLGMLKQEVEITVNEGLASRLESARRRVIEAQASVVH